MMKKKYTVFISSTYIDLMFERQKVLGIVLKADCIPVGMEYFHAEDDEQFKIIQKLIDDCDFYILIIGGRYGSINIKTGLSYTEMEYNYAIEKKIPILAFINNNITALPSEKKDSDVNAISKLEHFKTEVTKGRMTSMWDSPEKLVGDVAIALMDAKNNYERTGWTRGAMDTSDLLLQINSLKQENEKLAKDLSSAINEIYEFKKIGFDLAFDDIEIKIKYHYYQGNPSRTYYGSTIKTVKDIFKYVSIRMLGVRLSKSAIETVIKEMIGDSGHNCYLEDKQLVDTILNQFIALGLMTVHFDKTQFFGLTKKGEKLKNELNLIKKGEQYNT